MGIVKALDEADMPQASVEILDRVEKYIGKRGTNLQRVMAHTPPYFGALMDLHFHVMPSRKLRRAVKEAIAVAVSMCNGCAYCIHAHAHVLKSMFHWTDARLVELADVVAHVSGLNAFERAYLIDLNGLHLDVTLHDADHVPLLAEIEQTLGTLPLYYQVMAGDVSHLTGVWEREKAAMTQGELPSLDKALYALATSVTNGASYSVQLRHTLCRRAGVTDEQLMEALQVVELFNNNNRFTAGLQLEPSLTPTAVEPSAT